MDRFARVVIPVEFEKNHQHREETRLGSFMFIGELAAETGVDPKTIRFYERAGLLSPPRHGRFRTYMESDVHRLKNVLMMRRLGIGIADIRKMFETNTEITKSQQTINLLRGHLETLRNRQAQVAKQLEDTSAMLRHYSNEFDRSPETDTTP